MRSIIRHPITAACAFAATGLIFVACSESPTGPVAMPTGGANANVVVSLPNLGTPKATIQSGDAAVHFCGYNSTESPVAGTFTGVDCGSASNNLSTALAVYNPGWSAPFGTSSWIGPTSPDAPSSDYAARVGSYEFVTTFLVPSGVTSPSLQLSVKADNAVVVYLNGTEIGQHTFLQDCTVEQAGQCNWIVPLLMDNSPATLKVGMNNILRIDLVGTLIGRITDGVSHPTSTCAQLPQQFGEAGFSGTFTVPTSPNHQTGGTAWVVATCLNPSGLDFVTNLFWTPPAVNNGCTLGFWKNWTGLGSQANRWPAPYDPTSTTLLGAGFTNTGNDNTLMLDALSFSGGPTVQDAKNNLMKQAVAALLNAATPGMNYPLTTAQVLSQVNTALAGGNKGTILALASTLDGFNKLEGPLCGPLPVS